jgi:predicted MFS family arabinose efflux permease
VEAWPWWLPFPLAQCGARPGAGNASPAAGHPALGAGELGLITAQQARLVALAPALASVSLSMNSSAIHLGGAMGAAMGALIITDGAMERLGWVAAGFGLAALLSVLLSGGSTSGRG